MNIPFLVNGRTSIFTSQKEVGLRHQPIFIQIGEVSGKNCHQTTGPEHCRFRRNFIKPPARKRSIEQLLESATSNDTERSPKSLPVHERCHCWRCGEPSVRVPPPNHAYHPSQMSPRSGASKANVPPLDGEVQVFLAQNYFKSLGFFHERLTQKLHILQ